MPGLQNSQLRGKLWEKHGSQQLTYSEIRTSIGYDISGPLETLGYLSTALEGDPSFLVPLCLGLQTTLAFMSICQLSWGGKLVAVESPYEGVVGFRQRGIKWGVRKLTERLGQTESVGEQDSWIKMRDNNMAIFVRRSETKKGNQCAQEEKDRVGGQ